ncbi:hypothetical protein D3C85_1644820 [compost metagenome]
MQAGGACLVHGAPRVLQDAAAAHLLAIGRAAVGPVRVDQVVLHVQHQIDGIFHQAFLDVVGFRGDVIARSRDIG